MATVENPPQQALKLLERASPNRGPRKGVEGPDLVIVHYTNMPSARHALDRLCDGAAQVSAHYLIEPGGALWRLVAEEERAWHAGVSSWSRGRFVEADVNSRSIGVELAHPGHDETGVCAPFPEAQLSALEALLAQMLERWSIAPCGVLAHSDVAPGRKIDPGEKFDWRRLARRGLAEPAPTGASMNSEDLALQPRQWAAGFREALMRIGYGDWSDEALLDAFRRRWRPEALGRALEAEDLLFAQALAVSQESRR